MGAPAPLPTGPSIPPPTLYARRNPCASRVLSSVTLFNWAKVSPSSPHPSWLCAGGEGHSDRGAQEDVATSSNEGTQPEGGAGG